MAGPGAKEPSLDGEQVAGFLCEAHATTGARDVSEHGVAVQCLNGTAIPRYRLVYFQIDREARNRPDLPAALRKPNVLSAIFRVGPYSEQTGSPSDYALRLLVERDVHLVRDFGPRGIRLRADQRGGLGRDP